MKAEVKHNVPESVKRARYMWKQDVEEGLTIINVNQKVLWDENNRLREKISKINRKANKNAVLLLFLSLGTLIFMVTDMHQHKDINESINEIHKEVKRIKVKFIPK